MKFFQVLAKYCIKKCRIRIQHLLFNEILNYNHIWHQINFYFSLHSWYHGCGKVRTLMLIFNTESNLSILLYYLLSISIIEILSLNLVQTFSIFKYVRGMGLRPRSRPTSFIFNHKPYYGYKKYLTSIKYHTYWPIRTV